MIKILVVEDNDINQFVATKLLQRFGMEVEIANHGLEALEMIKSKSFQMVLMDIDMPVMDGFEATLRIREMPDTYFKNIPILAHTASAIPEAKVKAFKVGMTDFLDKPVRQDELLSMITKYVTPMKNEEPLSVGIDFDQYTDGDNEFKRELISLMIADLGELRNALTEALRLNEHAIFDAASHRVKTTVSMINDERLTTLISELKGGIREEKDIKSPVFSDGMRRFECIVENWLVSLVRMNQDDEGSLKIKAA